MELKKPAVAGTLESSDVQITLYPNPGRGIEMHLRSNVMVMFGESIEQTVRNTMAEFGIEDAIVDINDKGALDFVIRARTQCAICRAAEHKYDWGKESAHA